MKLPALSREKCEKLAHGVPGHHQALFGQGCAQVRCTGKHAYVWSQGLLN